VGRVTARLASRNAHKALELARVLPGWRVEPVGDVEFPPEDGTTYYENALAKARFGRRLAAPDEWVLGEDSGIEAAALAGAPGVRSARWGKPNEVERMLAELRGKEDRRARYVCELVCLEPDGTERRGRGTLEGTIALEPGGDEGFGYDPIFVPSGEKRTVAELGNEWKAVNSHRARAARALLDAAAQASPGTSSG
jgi:XTP/dITP diphosphohydrolase